MKSGKPQIHNLPINDVPTLGAFAYGLQQEAASEEEIVCGVREICAFADSH